MDAAPLRRPDALLTTHFLREFFANDLIAPEADRSQLIAVVGATLLSLTLFVSAIRSLTYVGPLLTPGLAAVLSLDDKFFYLAFGMIVTALVAAAQWDALAVDARDAAILEPLPLRTSTIRRAKLTAVGILGVVAATAVNVCPAIVFPSLLVYNLRHMGLLPLLGLIAAHAVFTIAASLFGYLLVIALRECALAALGMRWFARVSPWLQGALIIVLGSSLLVLPAAANRTAQRGFDGWRAMAPPTWFLGAYEITAGRILVDLPRSPMTPRQAANDRTATGLYRQRQAEFPAMARRAASALAVTFLVASAAYLRNARRGVALTALAPAVRSRWRLFDAVANAMLWQRAAVLAGFHFALAAMWRSNTHRLTLACAGAVGLAMAVVALTGATVSESGASSRLLAMQPLLYGALLVGFRHAIRVPAELRANWGFELAWRRHARGFVAGARWAAVVALVVPALAALLPLYAFLFGPRMALLHAGLGFCGALVFLEALMLTYDKVPFTCTYLPGDKLKALAPIYAGAFVMGAALFARMQYHALVGGGATRLVMVLAIAFLILRAIARMRARLPDVEFNEAPTTLQRLGLDA